jgi:hypothetical protein
LPLGSWLDRFGPKRVVLGFLLLAVAGCAAFAIASTRRPVSGRPYVEGAIVIVKRGGTARADVPTKIAHEATIAIEARRRRCMAHR